jgi:hypothetical protein
LVIEKRTSFREEVKKVELEEDMRIIPKYGMRELANQEDLSDGVIALMYSDEQSVLHIYCKE